MRLLQLLRLFKIKLPDFNDPAAVRAWLAEVIAFLEGIAKETGTAIDDAALALLKPLLTTEASFLVLYNLLKLIASKVPADADYVVGAVGDDAEIDEAVAAVVKEANAESAPTAIPWPLIIQIATAIVSILLKR